MSKYLTTVAAIGLIGSAAVSLPAQAAELQGAPVVQQVNWHGWHGRPYTRYWGPRAYWAPRPYWGPRYGYYGYYGYPYYRPGPVVSFGVGPFGFSVF